MDTKHINAENVAEVLYDDSHIFLVRQQPDHMRIQVLDRELEEISSYGVQYFFNPFLEGTVDADSLYLPTKDGMVLVLDKFTGEEFYSIHTNTAFWISQPQFFGGNMYVLGVVPISTGKYIKINSIVALSYESETGKKIMQSQAMRGSSASFSVASTGIHVVVDNTYYHYDLNCSVISTQNLIKEIDYPPIVGQRIYFAASTGTLVVLEKDKMTKYFVANNSAPPLYESNSESLYWFTHQGLYKICAGSINRIVPFKKKFVFAGFLEERMVAISEDAEIYVVEGDGIKTQTIVATQNVSSPHVLQGRLVTMFDKVLYSLEI